MGLFLFFCRDYNCASFICFCHGMKTTVSINNITNNDFAKGWIK